jgi:hypothetical protein
MALDHRTMLDPQPSIQSAATLHRLLAYLGATPEQAYRVRQQPPAIGSGRCPDHYFSPCRKNLLRIAYERL